MLVSRHLLKNAEELVLPGTWNRRTFLQATVELPNGADLDAYCNHLTPIFSASPINTFPYTRTVRQWVHRCPRLAGRARAARQKLINYVNETSGRRPAVIMGDFNASRAFPDQDIVAEGEATLDLLETAFEPAYGSDYTPQCTFCSDNPVTDAEVSSWIDHILLYNSAPESVLSTARIFDEDVVPVDGEMVPLSDHFGMRSVIMVP